MTTIGSTTEQPRLRRIEYAAGVLASALVIALVVRALLAENAGQVWDGDHTNLGRLATWLVISVSEPQYYAVASATAGLLVGGAVAHLAYRRSWRWHGFIQACGSGIWPWVVGSALASLLLSNMVWGWTLRPGVWQPSFVPLVSVAPAMVVHYGPRWAVSLTAVVLGALLTPPVAILAVAYVCKPWDLPLVVGATTGMWGGALIAFWLCQRLPWMPVPGEWRTSSDEVGATSGLWFVRRALADFSEAQFFGNEWASAAMIAGAVVAYLLSPSTVTYGSGLFPEVLAAQVITALAGVLLWRRRWQAHGFYPTLVPVVSVAPATVLAFGGTAQAIGAGALAGAVVAPPVAAAIAARLPVASHPFIGNVASMTVSTAVIVPVIGLLPGFAS
jgi:ENTS family enterobactin (siderophore) exporter